MLNRLINAVVLGLVGPLFAAGVFSGMGPPVSTAGAAADAGTMALLYAGRLSDGNVEGILDLFADDISFIGGAPCNVTPCIGKAAVRPRLEAARATHVHLRLTSVGTEENGTIARARGEQSSDPIRACGLASLGVIFTVEVKGDKISRQSNVMDPADPRTAAFAACNASPAAATGPTAAPAPIILPPATGDAGLKCAQETSMGVC